MTIMKMTIRTWVFLVIAGLGFLCGYTGYVWAVNCPCRIHYGNKCSGVSLVCGDYKTSGTCLGAVEVLTVLNTGWAPTGYYVTGSEQKPCTKTMICVWSTPPGGGEYACRETGNPVYGNQTAESVLSDECPAQ